MTRHVCLQLRKICFTSVHHLPGRIPTAYKLHECRSRVPTSTAVLLYKAVHHVDPQVASHGRSSDAIRRQLKRRLLQNSGFWLPRYSKFSKYTCIYITADTCKTFTGKSCLYVNISCLTSVAHTQTVQARTRIISQIRNVIEENLSNK